MALDEVVTQNRAILKLSAIYGEGRLGTNEESVAFVEDLDGQKYLATPSDERTRTR